MLAAAACSLLLVSTVIAFQGWPEVGTGGLAPSSLVVASPDADSGPGSTLTRAGASADPVVMGRAPARAAASVGTRPSAGTTASTDRSSPSAGEAAGAVALTQTAAPATSPSSNSTAAPSAPAAPAASPGKVVSGATDAVGGAVTGATGATPAPVVDTGAQVGGVVQEAGRQAGGVVDGLLGRP